ncbi:T9SS type A sorting domain-containing protein [Flavobacterium zepuense]|uniref:T9SS type A sorting domain-containing protein n=1 Tax=Flavobacterium zepuense TaxID=2593302 RepID=A0A552UZ92_9FLAO|nr:T9SS type A sorting domain-containing protein [Flavobacterium zepuense]TRW23546.1 T9SS type A sorting domain-containing protein [Flavobacterium zepuense]
MKKNYVLLIFTFFILAPCYSAIIYVKPDGSGNGTSWANAYGSLSTALQNALSGDEIWVKQGTYKPTTGLDANASFTFKNGVKVYGGFIGIETTLTARADVSGTTTFLSGLLSTSVHSKTILKVKNSLSDLNLLDGFTIRDAHWVMTAAQNGGAGVQVIASKIELKNVHINHNTIELINVLPYANSDSLIGGAGIYSRQSDIKLRNVHVKDNNLNMSYTTIVNNGGSQGSGAGIFVLKGKINFKKGTIDNNRINNTNYLVLGGGGAFISQADSVHLEAVTVKNNRLISNNSITGAGLHLMSDSKVKLINNLYYNNFCNPTSDGSSNSGHAVYFANTTVTVSNNTFGRNNPINVDPAPEGVSISFSNLTFNNCVFLERFRHSPTGNTIVHNKSISKYLIDQGTQNNVTIAEMGFVNIHSGNYTPKSCSTYLNIGTNSYNTITTDLNGNPRIVGSAIDPGAIELQNQWDNRVYVDVASTNSTQDGTSWATAFTDLQDALNCGCVVNSVSTHPAEVWVAEGTYNLKVPVNSEDPMYADNYLYQSFLLKKNQKLYGGLINGATTLTERDTTFATHQSILSGLTELGKVYVVVEAANTDFTTELNGFIVQDGYAVQDPGPVNYNCGPGISVRDGAITLNNVWVRDNTSRQDGGGIFVQYSALHADNLKVTGNTSLDGMGGGIAYWTLSGSVIPQSVLKHLEISNNTADFAGGGLKTEINANITIEDFKIENNTAMYYGGGAYLSQGTVTMAGGVFKNNSLADGSTGGAVFADNTGTPNTTSFESVLFSGNTGSNGGAISSANNHLSCVNCTFVGNVASTNGNVAFVSGITPGAFSVKNSIIVNGTGNDMMGWPAQTTANPGITIEHSLLTGSLPTVFTNGGNLQLNTDPEFVDAANGDYRLIGCGPAVDMGVNALITLNPQHDAGEETRIKNSIVDLGAFEYQYLDLAFTDQPDAVTLNIGETATFTVVTENVGITYQWQVSTNNGTTWTNIANATQPVLTVTNVTAAMHHYLYRCVLADCASSLNSANAMLNVNGVTGLDDVAFAGLTLYPNPANSQFALQYAAATTDVNLTVYDLNGRLIHTADVSAQQLHDGAVVNVVAWANGVYIIQLTGGGQATYKFVKN